MIGGLKQDFDLHRAEVRRELGDTAAKVQSFEEKFQGLVDRVGKLEEVPIRAGGPEKGWASQDERGLECLGTTHGT